jgi:hypothetical protein
MSQRTLISAAAVFFLSVLLFLFALFGDRPLPTFLWGSFKVFYIVGLHYLALWFLLTRFFGAARAGTVLVNLSIALTTTLGLLIGAEFALRFAFRDVTTSSDYLSYFSRKWVKTVHFNRLGFRERDFEPKKPPGTYRIAVIGDSLAYGTGISEDARFSNLLEHHLNDKNDRKYQVLNFARPGANGPEEIEFLTRAIFTSNPDFILLQWYINDPEGDDAGQKPRPLTIIPPILRRSSALFYLLHKELGDIQGRIGLVGSYDQYMLARFGNPNSPASLKAARMLHMFVEICRKFDIPLGMVLFSESYFNRTSRLDFLLERMLALCREQGLRCVDTRSVLLPLQGDARLWASKFDPHPSALANRLVADRLLEAFGDMWRR